MPVADGEQHVLAGGLMQVLQVGQRGGAQPVPAWRERRDLQQPQSDHVTAIPGALQGPPLDEFAGQAQGAGLGQAGPGTQRRQGQRAVRGAERPEYPEGPVQDRLALRGAPPRPRVLPATAPPRVVPINETTDVHPGRW